MVGAKRFFALATRLPAHPGVLAARVAIEQDEDSAAPASARDVPQEVSVDAMNLISPGLIERVEV